MVDYVTIDFVWINILYMILTSIFVIHIAFVQIRLLRVYGDLESRIKKLENGKK